MTIILAASFAAFAAASASAPMTVAAHGCMNNARLLSHAAYTVSSSLPVKSCSHLLSTDRVVAHAWNRT